MRCQSDYGTEADALLTQTDLCVDGWWQDEVQEQEEPSKKAFKEEESALIVKREVRKRGLDEVSEQAGL